MLCLSFKMFFSITITILTALVYYGAAQPKIDQFKEKPEACYDTDELTERRCCIFPPFFDQLAAKGCGALFYHVFTDKEHNVTGIRRDMFSRSDYWRCILNKYKLLNEDDKLIHEKYYNHLDKWASLNRDFVNVLASAKIFCMNTYRYRMPIEVRDFFEFQQCIRNYINVDCPVIIQSKECSEWKEFYEECREFYI